MRCFSVCWRSQFGHLYDTKEMSQPSAAASCGAAALKAGLRKFSTSQKCRCAEGLARVAESTMILMKRS